MVNKTWRTKSLCNAGIWHALAAIPWSETMLATNFVTRGNRLSIASCLRDEREQELFKQGFKVRKGGIRLFFLSTNRNAVRPVFGLSFKTFSTVRQKGRAPAFVLVLNCLSCVFKASVAGVCHWFPHSRGRSFVTATRLTSVRHATGSWVLPGSTVVGVLNGIRSRSCVRS